MATYYYGNVQWRCVSTSGHRWHLELDASVSPLLL